jgi:hypothetical protein
MHKESLAEYKAALNEVYGDRQVEEALDRGYAEGGYTVAMRRAAEALVSRAQKANVNATDIAGAYMYAGEKVHALDWLEKAFEVRDPNLPYIGIPDNDSLRSEPRFQALLRRMNLPQ